MRNTPEMVYYYCKPHVFESIIRNKEIWLCDMAKTNDYMEVQHVLQGFIDKSETDCPLPGWKNRKDYILPLLKTACEKLRNKYHWFAICFTEMEDHLAQWRTYGFNGKGFCIGFDYEKIKNLKSHSLDLKLLFDKMAYANKDSITYVNDIFNNFWSEARAKESQEKISEDMIFHILERYVRKMCFTKNLRFKYENEWWLSCAQRHEDMLACACKNAEAVEAAEKCEKETLRQQLPYGLSIRERDAVLYVKQKIDTDMISKIIIGPQNGATQKDVELLLAMNGFGNTNVHIGKSNATYRS